MNTQQAVQARSSFNAFSQPRVEKDSSRMENTFQPGKSNPNRMDSAGTGGSIGSHTSSQDWLVYLTTCLIGHHVEVQVTNGSVLSGIFHATNAEGDFGVVLKMACVTKDVSSRVQKTASDSVSKALKKTLIIPAHELVQVVAKDVPITSHGQSNELQGGKQRDIMLDSYISQSRRVGLERELQPWMPDEDALQCPELENIFDSPWTGSWDQFKVNEALFGVKSSFNEELYTTKLERGPQMRELEEEALRIAREIEGEEVHDLHLAEERGTYPHGNLDVDEETKYSSVYRSVDDSGYADEDVMLNSHDTETLKEPAGPSFGRSFADVTSGRSRRGFKGGRILSGTLPEDEVQLVQVNANHDLCQSGSLSFDHSSMAIHGFADDSRVQETHTDEQRGNTCVEENVNEEAQSAVCDCEMCALPEDQSGKVHDTAEVTNPHGRLVNSTPSTSESEPATATPSVRGLSPSSSVGSLSSERSTLNPNAKEFKLNPNAKSFLPSQSPLRPVSPVNDGSFYYPAGMPSVPHMQTMPVGMGVGPSFAGHQPVLFNPQTAAMHSPQAYFPANGPQYGQPMILGHPRQVMYMQGYPTEMPYKR